MDAIEDGTPVVRNAGDGAAVVEVGSDGIKRDFRN